jgi:hypothetical protein
MTMSSSYRNPPRPDEPFAPHPSNVEAVLTLHPADAFMLVSALEYHAEASKRWQNEYMKAIDLGARVRSALSALPRDEYGYISPFEAGNRVFLKLTNRELFALSHALHDSALHHAENVGNPSHYGKAAWAVADEIDALQDRIDAAWGREN